MAEEIMKTFSALSLETGEMKTFRIYDEDAQNRTAGIGGLAQTTGDSPSLVMSQDAVTDALNSKSSETTPGEPGPKGTTYTPSVSADGVISWSNDGGLENPEPVNIKGPKGDDGHTTQKNVDYFDGEDGKPGKDGTSVTHSWNGTTLTVTSASGTSSANLKGATGDDGKDAYDMPGYMTGGTVVLDNVDNGAYTLKFEDWGGVISDLPDAGSVTVTNTAKEKVVGYIEENCAPLGAKRIGVYSGSSKVGNVRLTHPYLKTETGDKLYSFGALSDVHYQNNTAPEDFQRALMFMKNYGAAFTCICGDLTANGTDSELAAYKSCVDSYSQGVPVYAITGNHEGYNYQNIESIIETYTGHPLYYKFTQGNDVFIMVGVKSSTDAYLFTTEELQWLYETLEEHRNQRCFVFQHVRPQDGCGNAFGIYDYDIWGGTEATVFESLMRHYRNVTLFHGHSHLKLDLQAEHRKANYDNDFGIHSVHIPSLAVPRDGDATGSASRVELAAESEGYVVDVYEDGIMIRGRDFVGEKYLPVGTYWLDTSLEYVAEKTYRDATGTIVTGSASGGDTGGDTGGDGGDTGPTYTNLLPTAIGFNGNILEDVDGNSSGTGFVNGWYLSGNPNTSSNTGYSFMSTDSTHFVTGFMPYTRAQYDAGTPIYVKGITLDTSQSHTRMGVYPDYTRNVYVDPIKFSTGDIDVTELSAGYYKFVPNAKFLSDMSGYYSDWSYMRFSFKGKGEGVIVSVGNPINE